MGDRSTSFLDGKGVLGKRRPGALVTQSGEFGALSLGLRAETGRLADAIRRLGDSVHGAPVVDRSDCDAIQALRDTDRRATRSARRRKVNACDRVERLACRVASRGAQPDGVHVVAAARNVGSTQRRGSSFGFARLTPKRRHRSAKLPHGSSSTAAMKRILSSTTRVSFHGIGDSFVAKPAVWPTRHSRKCVNRAPGLRLRGARSNVSTERPV